MLRRPRRHFLFLAVAVGEHEPRTGDDALIIEALNDVVDYLARYAGLACSGLEVGDESRAGDVCARAGYHRAVDVARHVHTRALMVPESIVVLEHDLARGTIKIGVHFAAVIMKRYQGREELDGNEGRRGGRRLSWGRLDRV